MAGLLRVSGLHPADVVENPNQNYTSSESEYGNRFGCCRLCCHDETTLRGLFPRGYKDEVLLRKIFECTTVQISYSEDSDALICHGCVGKIDEFYQFREQCRTNDVLQRNWKRRMNRSMEASRSTLIPVNDIKHEQDIEYDYCDIDIDDDQEDPARFQTNSGLEEPAMGEESLPGPTMLLDSSISQEQEDGTHCGVRVKQEPDDEEIDDTMYVWNEEESLPTEKQPATPTLLPIIENAFSTAPESPFSDAVAKHRHIQCASGQVYLFREGYLYLRKPSGSGNPAGCGTSTGASGSGWRCRKFDCDAALHRNRARQIVSNGIRHNHTREQQPTATDAEVLAFLGESTPKSQFLKPFVVSRNAWKPTTFRYVKNVRNGRSIVHDGYRYSKKHARADGTSFWKCRLNGGTCAAGLFLTPRNTIRITGCHNHKRHLGREPRRKLKSHLEYGAEEENGADDAENEESPKLEPVENDAQDTEEISLSDYLSTHMEESDPSQMQATTSSTGDFAREPTAGSSGAAAAANKGGAAAPGTLRLGFNFQIVRNVNQKLRLLFDGHLYVKEHQRTDGAIVWRCRRNYDKCSVLAVQHQAGWVEILGEHSHDHLQERRSNILVEPSGTFAYRLVKTAHNLEQLIYDGHRYQKAVTKGDGSTVWRCVRRSTNCKESVVLSADGKVYEMESQNHPHKPSELPIPDRMVEENRRRHAQAPHAALKVTVAGQKCTFRKQITTKPRPIPIGHVTRVPMEMQRQYSYRIGNTAKGYESLKHGGYRYCKSRVRADGTIKWLCKMNNKTCGAWFNMEPDGSIPSIGSVTHNHLPSEEDVVPVQRTPKARALSDAADTKEYPIDERTFAKSEWYFVKNIKNGSTLIHAGYRYTKKGERVDKSSLWRCAFFTRKCRAGIILFPNETIAKADQSEHVHPPVDMDNVEQECETADMEDEGAEEDEEDSGEDSEDEEEQEEEVVDIGADTFDLSGGINEDADPETMMRSLLSTSLGVGDGDPKTDSDPIFLSKEEAGYRLVKNRRQTNSLLFRGYRYSLQGSRANGSVVWMCQMNNKTCRASIRIHPDDRIELVNVQHNHGMLEEDIESYEEQQAPDGDDGAQYYYSMNRCNRRCVIYDRCRYGNPTKRVDGSCVWRCAMSAGTCLASVLIEADGTLTKRADFYHNHQPLTELPARVSGPMTATAKGVAPLVRPKEPWNSAKAVIKGNILSWKQYRYRKHATLPDGTVLWACATSDACMGRAKVVVQGNQMRIQSSRSHNHDPVLPVGGGGGPQPSATRVTKRETPYTPYRRSNGRVALVYEQNRYEVQGRRKDGVTYWSCRGTKVPCPVLIFVNADGEITKVNDAEHTHAPTDAVIAPDMELLQLDGQQSWDDFIQDYLKKPLPLSGSGSDDPDALQKLPNNVLRYRNYVYRLALTRDDGIEYWRCFRYQSDECRSMLHCRNNGTELVDNRNNGMRHNHDREALHGSIPPLEAADEDHNVCSLKLRQGETYSSFGTYGIMRRRGGTKSLVHRDRRYYLAYTLTDGVTVWRCAQRKRCKCLAVIRVGTNGEMLRTDEHRHNHPVEKTDIADSPTGEDEPVKTKERRSPEFTPVRPTTVPNRSRGRMLESNGTRHFTYEGRHGRTVVCEGYRYCCTWQRKDGTGFYRCLGYGTHACPMKVKVCPNGKLYPHRGDRHSHSVPESSRRNSGFTVASIPEQKPAALLPPPPPAPAPPAPAPAPLASPRRERRSVGSWKMDARACKNYRIVPTLRGTMLQHEGFEYWTHSRLADGSVTYRCRLQFKQKCLASVHLEKPSKLLYVRSDMSHNHRETDESYVAATKAESDQSKQCPAVPDEALLPKESSPPVEECTNGEELEGSAVEQADEADDDDDKDGNKASDQDEGEEGVQAANNAVDNAADRESGHAGESHVVTKKYTFGKMAPHKRYLVHDKHLYEYEADQPDGSKRYSCHMKAVCECSASVVLLIPSARLQVPLRLVHEHDPPVADYMKDVKIIGRGSKDFKIIESKNGTKMLLFRGERYQAPRPKLDGSVSWYCHELTSKGRKCYLLQELLPNGRAAPSSERTHDHVSFAEMQAGVERAVEAPPPKAAAAAADSAKAPPTHTKMLRNGGFWYEFGRECRDGSVLWLCRRKNSCEASVYRLPDGRILKGLKAEHTHLPDDITRESTVKATESAGASKNTSAGSTSKSLLKVKPSSKKAEGRLWHAGNRFWFYYMRNDGIEHWRCSKRQTLGCRAGIIRTPDGSVEPYKKIPHSHSLEQEDAQGGEKPPPAQSIAVKDEAKEPDLDTDSTMKHFIEYQNHRLFRRYLPETGKVVYECPRAHCNFNVTLSEGDNKVVQAKGTEHSCSRQSSNNLPSNWKESNQETEPPELVGLSSSKANDDGGAQNKESDRDRTPVDSAAKRIRLDANLTKEEPKEEPKEKKEFGGQERVTEEEDSSVAGEHRETHASSSTNSQAGEAMESDEPGGAGEELSPPKDTRDPVENCAENGFPSDQLEQISEDSLDDMIIEEQFVDAEELIEFSDVTPAAAVIEDETVATEGGAGSGESTRVHPIADERDSE
ncbi:uncharacterized protein LOC128270414 [Anopheles cruzii]|uniref:uncharacterized protein LOC128270414 n=1 Tax=Anopheles cruzii TaxID=68878 RepID=UPI0022EC665B|nr:uncharacterized protein LOC128270414 [Anopheles cruzii]